MPRRRHYKVTRALPPELVEEVNRRIVEGHTYEEIAGWLRQMGRPVSKSAVQRYGSHYLTTMERLKLARDQARAIIEEAGDLPDTAMAQAASEIAIQLIMEALMSVNERGPDGLDKKVIEAMKALAQLEKSAVAREKLKFDYRQKAEAMVGGLKDEDLAGKTPEEIREIIRQRIREEYGG